MKFITRKQIMRAMNLNLREWTRFKSQTKLESASHGLYDVDAYEVARLEYEQRRTT